MHRAIIIIGQCHFHFRCLASHACEAFRKLVLDMHVSGYQGILQAAVQPFLHTVPALLYQH